MKKVIFTRFFNSKESEKALSRAKKCIPTILPYGMGMVAVSGYYAGYDKENGDILIIFPGTECPSKEVEDFFKSFKNNLKKARFTIIDERLVKEDMFVLPDTETNSNFLTHYFRLKK